MKKNRPSSKKPRRSKSSQNRLQRKLQRNQSSSDFDYQTLEQRLPLDASFAYDNMNQTLDLTQFTSDVTFSHDGDAFTAVLSSGRWMGEDPTDDVDDINFDAATLTLPSNFLTAVNVATLGNNSLTFRASTFDANQSVNINSNSNFEVLQTGAVDLDILSVIGNGTFNFDNPENRLSLLNVDVTGDATVFSETSISGNIFSGDNVTVIVTNPNTNPTLNYNEISGPGRIIINVDGDLTVIEEVNSPDNVQIASGQDIVLGDVGNNRTDFIDIEANSITAGNLTTTFTSVANDINNIGKEPVTSIRLRATGGQPVIGVPGSDNPIGRDNTAGGLTVSGTVIADQILLQSSNGIAIPLGNLDTLYLYLGGDLEAESRGEFQLNVPSLQQLSVNLYDGFDITSQQDLTIGNFKYTGVDDGDDQTTNDEFDDQEFTNPYSDLYARVSAKSLIFDTPFSSQKLVADITTDIEQNAGAALQIDDLYISAKRVVLDNPDNDFQRIAAVGKGFAVDNRTNNEDILTIRDQGNLEIAVLNNQPDDSVVVNFAEPIPNETQAGISLAGQVDIQTGLGGPAPIQPVDAVEPTPEQLGNTLNNPTQYQIERFEIPRDRSGTQTGVFRDDNYNGAIRPVYYIEFVYDGTEDLTIRTDEFERGNPERVRNFIDIELALYNDLGEVVALGDDVDRELDEINFAAGTLAPGRYFVAASAFSTEFENDFVVKTANTQTGTLNITITGNTAVTPETSRDLTQAVGAPLIVLGGDEPVPDDDLFEEDPADFTPDRLVQLDPNANDFVPDRRRRNPIGDPLPEVDGRATLSAANGGSVQLGQVDSNDIRELVINEAETVEFVDTNDLLVSNLDTPDQARLAAGRAGAGQLTVGDITTPKLLLQASSGVNQKGILTTDTLLLGGDSAIDGGGDFVILSDTLENLAFNLPAGNLALTTSQELTLAFEQYSDSENPLAPRFIFNQSVVGNAARIEAASINVNTRVVADTLVLNVDNSIVQAAEIIVPPNFDPELIPSVPSIAADALSVSATTVTLDQPRNEINRFAGNITGTGDALNLLNRTPIVFATIDNTIEAVTRLRPVGVSQVFGPLMTINGLTVAGMANITTGIEPDDPTANPNAIVTINPVVVSNDDGTNTANFFGNEVQEAEIKRLIDVIYLQAGIDVEWLPTQSWNNSFANIGDGTTGDDGERPRGDLFTIVTNGDAAGVGSPDPNVIDLYAVRITPGNPPAIGLGFVGAPGNTIQVDDGAPATANGRALTAFLAAHEIGHNLGLGHVEGTPDNLMNPFIRATPPPTLNAEQAATALASPLSSEPAGVLGGFTQEGDAPINIGTANFTARGNGDIILLNPENDVNFVGTDARDVSVALVDESVVTSITANRNLLIEGAGNLTVENTNSLDGSTTINAADDVLIGQVTAAATTATEGTVTVTSTTGSINDLQDDQVADIGASGIITLSANDEIGGNTPAGIVTDVDGRIEFANLSVVTATSTAGDVTLGGVGDLTLQSISTTAGNINVTADDVLVGSVSSSSTIDITSTGSINDLQDDLVADFTANGLVTLLADGDIGGGATPTAVDTAGQLEFGDGTVVSTQTTGGGIVVGGDGTLTFEDIKTPDDLKINATDDLVIRNVMARSAMLSAVNDVTINSVMTTNETMINAGMNVDVEEVIASEATLTAGGILDVVAVTATTGNATLTSIGNMIAGTITADSGGVVMDSGADLNAGNIAGQTASIASAGATTVDSITTVDAVSVNATGNATLGTITAASADLDSAATLSVTQVATTGDASLDANSIVANVVDAVGSAALTAAQDIDAENISGSSATLTAGGILDAATVTADTGDATLTSTGNMILGTATAGNGAVAIDSGADLNAGGIVGDSTNITVAGITTIANIDTDGLAMLTSVGDATIGSVEAGDAMLASTAGILTVSRNVVTTGKAQLAADGGLTLQNINADGDVVLDSPNNISVDSIDGTSATLTSGGTTAVNAITTVGATSVNATGNATLGTITAASADLDSAATLSVTQVATTGDASLDANSIIADVVDAVGSAALTAAQDIDAENISGSSATLTAGGILDAATVTADTGDATLTSTGNMILGTATAGNGAVAIDSGADLNAGGIVGDSTNITVAGITTIANIDTDGLAMLTSVGDATIGSVEAGDAMLASTAGSLTVSGNVVTTGKAQLAADGGLTLQNINADGDVVLDSPNNISVDSIDGASATLTSGGTTAVNAITTVGSTSVNATGNATLGTITAASADIDSAATLSVTQVATTGDASLDANSIIADVVDAVGLAVLTAAQDIDAENISGSSATLTAGGILDAATVTADTGDATLTSTGNMILGTATAGNGAVAIDSGADLNAGGIVGNSTNITAAGITTIANIDTDGLAMLTSVGDATIGSVEAGDAMLASTTGILTVSGNVVTTGKAQLAADGGLTLQNINADGDVVLDSPNNISVDSIDSASATLTSGGTTAVNAITTVGATSVNATGNATLGTVTAGSADLNSNARLTTSTVSTTENASLAATDIVSDFVDAGGIAALTASGNIDASNTSGSSTRLSAGGALEAILVNATTGNASLTATGNLSVRSVTASNGAANLDTESALTVSNIVAETSNINADGLTGISRIETTGLAMLNSGGAATINTVVGGESMFSSDATLFISNDIDNDGKTQLFGNQGLTVRNIGSTGPVILGSNADVNTLSITAPTVGITSGGVTNVVGTITTSGVATVNANGNANLQDIVSGSADLASQAALTATSVVANTDNATLSAGTDLAVTSVVANSGSAALFATNITTGTVSAQSSFLNALGSIDADSVVATEGNAILSAQQTIDVTTVNAMVNASVTGVGDVNAGTVTATTGLASLRSDAQLTSVNVTGADATLVAGSDLNAGNVISTVGDINLTARNQLNAAMVMAQNNANLTTSTGNIVTSQDVITKAGVATLTSGASVDIAGIDVVGLTIDAVNDIEAGDVSVVENIELTSQGKILTGDLIASAVSLDANTTLETGNVTATVGNVDLKSVAGLVAGSVNSDNGDITLESGQTIEAGVLDAANVTLTSGGNTNIAAVTASATATLTSAGTLEVQTVDAQTAVLTASQNITLDTVATVGNATLNAGDGNLNGNTVTSTTGAIGLSSLQRVNITEAIAAGDVTFEAGNQVNTDRAVSETGSVRINSNNNLSAKVVEAAVDAILLAPRSDVFSNSVTAGQSAQLTAGAYLFTRNVVAPDVTMTAGTNQVAQRVIADTATISAARDLGLNDIQADQLTIEAGDDIYDTQWRDGNQVKTDSLFIRAGNNNDEGTFGGIVLETDVNALSVEIMGEAFGNLTIREVDDIQLGNIDVGNGRINISAGGSISGGNIRTRVQNDQNDVRLMATGDASDIRVDRIDVGNVGDAFLIADDDVVITGEGKEVKADYIFVSAKNRSVDGIDGIALSTNIKTADLVVGFKADATQNRGDIEITDVNAVNLNFARTLNGKINATANGNLVATNIQSEGVNEADAIRLTAVGNGADVVTGRVVVRQQAGSIVLTADDDIRDSNPQDNLRTIADNLTMVANNNLDDSFNGINTQTRVKSINASVTSEAIPDGSGEGFRDAFISVANTGLLRVNKIDLTSGLVRVINNGFLTVDDITIAGSSGDNRVLLKTEGNRSDIVVGKVDSGTRGSVQIDSSDDIYDTDQRDNLFVTGGFLSATSRNGSDDTFDGIILNVDIDRFVADAQKDGRQVIRQRG